MQEMSKRSEAWLRKKYESYEPQSVTTNNGDTEEVESGPDPYTTEQDNSSSARGKMTESNSPFKRALTLHKPNNIGSILNNELDALSGSDNISDSGKRKDSKRSNKKKKKRHSKFKQSFIMCPAEVIEEEDRDCDSGRTFTAPNTNRFVENKTQFFSNHTRRKKSMELFEELESSRDDENVSSSRGSEASKFNRRANKKSNVLLLL